jgi:pimeloyl-ACP methyl ester carboxylesterase
MFTTDSLSTAPNLAVEATNGVTYAYRRLGDAPVGAPPLVLLQHFRGNLDNWDPALVDALASMREVILFDNAGVGGSTGRTPRTVTAMAHDALRFLEALEVREVDLLGFSLGGFVAQELVLVRPRLVRRLVLAGTGPQGGEDMHGFADDVYISATRDEPGAEDLLALFFEHSETSVTAGWEFVERIFCRKDDRDAPTTLATRDAQLDAIHTWGIPDAGKLSRLAGIT